MEVVFMGTGTSQGVPMIACDCAVCRSSDPKNHRSRASIHVIMGDLRIQVDAAPEFRIQCLRERIKWIDLFILTHGHADHIAGMDDLRRFCDLLGFQAMPVFTTEEGAQRIQSVYPYTILDKPVVRGYAAFKVQQMPKKMELPQGTIESVLLPHGGVHTLGLVFTEAGTEKKFAYFTDCKAVPEEALKIANGANAVVLDGLRFEPHPTHMSIDEAVSVAKQIRAPQAYLTHMTHAIDHQTVCDQLPVGVTLAYDGLRLAL